MSDQSNGESSRHPQIETVFLSYHFGEESELIAAIKELIERHGLEVITGERLGGEEVSRAVKERIQGSDSLIAVMTKRYKIASPDEELWDTYPWVRDELIYGYQMDKPTIAIVEGGVEVAGAFSNYERIEFDRDRKNSAMEALEQHLLLWTGQLGPKPIKVHLHTSSNLRRLFKDGEMRCRYRWWTPPDVPEEWSFAEILAGPGGFYIFVRRPINFSSLIQVEVLKEGRVYFGGNWTTAEIWMELRQVEG